MLPQHNPPVTTGCGDADHRTGNTPRDPYAESHRLLADLLAEDPSVPRPRRGDYVFAHATSVAEVEEVARRRGLRVEYGRDHVWADLHVGYLVYRITATIWGGEAS